MARCAPIARASVTRFRRVRCSWTSRRRLQLRRRKLRRRPNPGRRTRPRAERQLVAMPASLPAQVQIVEVGPRDGLQNEPTDRPVSTATKLELIERLADAGLRRIEATAFVSPRRIAQMADHETLLRSLPARQGVRYSVLTPNLQGVQAALAAGAQEVAVFGAASETFSQKNIHCSIAESLQRFEQVTEAARRHGVPVRGYVSCALGCPYEGHIAPAAVAHVAGALHAMGCYEISLGDTIGVGTPAATVAMLEACAAQVPRA